MNMTILDAYGLSTEKKIRLLRTFQTDHFIRADNNVPPDWSTRVTFDSQIEKEVVDWLIKNGCGIQMVGHEERKEN